MRESRSSGSVGERGGNEPLYPDDIFNIFTKYKENIVMVRSIRPTN
jgi:hypothetical protein